MASQQQWQARFAAQVIRQGGVVAHPTEGVWGLACDPFSEEAVDSLLALKNRPSEKGLILLSARESDFTSLLAPLSAQMLAQFKSPQTRPTTWIIPDLADSLPSWIKGKHKGLAVRVTTHPLVKALTDYLGGPIISTSANPSGRPPAMSVQDIRHYFSRRVDFILSGKLGGATRPSRIIDLESGKILRD